MRFNRERRGVGGLRRSQLLTSAGCGAIVDMPNESVVIAGIDFWKPSTEEDKISEANLERYLGVDHFMVPPAGGNGDFAKTTYDIPAFRFPNMMFCPKCKRLARDNEFGFSKRPKCSACNTNLIPSRFVTACDKGHLDDFPYSWWVHQGNGKEKCDRPFLKIETTERSSGLDSIYVSCRCGATRNMSGCFGKNALKGLRCRGRRPWLDDKEDCGEPVRVLQRGASNLYYAVTASALSIPPWSSAIQQELGRRSSLKSLVSNPDLFKQVVIHDRLPEKLRCTAEELLQQAKYAFFNQDNPQPKSWQELLEDEYRAFIDSVEVDDGEFKVAHAHVPEWLRGMVDSVALASRLREVIALRGFKRISPDYDKDNKDSFTKLSRENKDWLPGMELHGEGIFIKLNEEQLNKWEQKPVVLERFMRIKTAMESSVFKIDHLSPRYILLHTLSHLLIRQLVLECGYSSASVKERIYTSFINEEKYINMAGILIYTATNDSEGSLGGLVREGHPDRFENLFRQMLENSSWCSSDPLCIQSAGQGVDSLNLAACHSCTLLPETSCESMNCFLDRAMIVGNIDEGRTGYFRDLLAGGK